MSEANDADTLGARLMLARERSGYTVPALAERLGVMPDSLLAWEGGERDPRANRLMLMAGMLGVSLGWLLEGDSADLPGVDQRTTLESLREELEDMDGQLAELRGRLRGALGSIEQVSRRLRRGDAEEVIGESGAN